MDKFLETCNLSRLNHDETENLNRLNTTKETESVTKNFPKKQKSRTRWFPWCILPNIQERINIILSKFFPKNRRGGNTSKLILRGQHYPDAKHRQGYYKKRKLQASIPPQYRCKNSQQNTS